MNIVNLKLGVRTNIGFYHNSFYVGFGQALTHDDWYKHIDRLEYAVRSTHVYGITCSNAVILESQWSII